MQMVFEMCLENMKETLVLRLFEKNTANIIGSYYFNTTTNAFTLSMTLKSMMMGKCLTWSWDSCGSLWMEAGLDG